MIGVVFFYSIGTAVNLLCDSFFFFSYSSMSKFRDRIKFIDKSCINKYISYLDSDKMKCDSMSINQKPETFQKKLTTAKEILALI